MADRKRLAELGTATPLAKELAAQIDAVGGAFTPAADPGDSVAEDVATLVADYNTLLANLRTAGLIA